jgi:hypothetical protein
VGCGVAMGGRCVWTDGAGFRRLRYLAIADSAGVRLPRKYPLWTAAEASTKLPARQNSGVVARLGLVARAVASFCRVGVGLVL